MTDYTFMWDSAREGCGVSTIHSEEEMLERVKRVMQDSGATVTITRVVN